MAAKLTGGLAPAKAPSPPWGVAARQVFISLFDMTNYAWQYVSLLRRIRAAADMGDRSSLDPQEIVDECMRLHLPRSASLFRDLNREGAATADALRTRLQVIATAMETELQRIMFLYLSKDAEETYYRAALGP